MILTVIRNKAVWSLLAVNTTVLLALLAFDWLTSQLTYRFGIYSQSENLQVIKNVLGILFPVLAGLLADYYSQKQKKNWPLITIGIGGAVAASLLVASFGILGNNTFLKSVLPVVLLSWIGSIYLFQSPVLALVDRVVSQKELPVLMVLLLISSNLVLGYSGFLQASFDKLGVGVVFSLCAILLLVFGYFLRMQLKRLGDSFINHSAFNYAGFSALWLPFVIGVSIAVMQKDVKISWLNSYEVLSASSRFSNLVTNSDSWLMVFYLISALLSVFLLFVHIDKLFSKLFLAGIFLHFILGRLLGHLTFEWYFVSILQLSLVAYLLMSFSAIPLSLSFVTTKRKFTGLGLFFAGLSSVNFFIH